MSIEKFLGEPQLFHKEITKPMTWFMSMMRSKIFSIKHRSQRDSWLFRVLVDIAGDGNSPFFACDSLTFG